MAYDGLDRRSFCEVSLIVLNGVRWLIAPSLVPGLKSGGNLATFWFSCTVAKAGNGRVASLAPLLGVRLLGPAPTWAVVGTLLNSVGLASGGSSEIALLPALEVGLWRPARDGGSWGGPIIPLEGRLPGRVASLPPDFGVTGRGKGSSRRGGNSAVLGRPKVAELG